MSSQCVCVCVCPCTLSLLIVRCDQNHYCLENTVLLTQEGDGWMALVCGLGCRAELWVQGSLSTLGSVHSSQQPCPQHGGDFCWQLYFMEGCLLMNTDQRLKESAAVRSWQVLPSSLLGNSCVELGTSCLSLQPQLFIWEPCFFIPRSVSTLKDDCSPPSVLLILHIQENSLTQWSMQWVSS